MTFIIGVMGDLLSEADTLFALIVFFLFAGWTGYEISHIPNNPSKAQKVSHALRAALILFVASFLGGLYAEGNNFLPSRISSIIIFFPLLFVSIVIGGFFSQRKGRFEDRRKL